jgi:hypothetical protein
MTNPEAVHLGRDDLPYIDIGDGSKLLVLQVKLYFKSSEIQLDLEYGLEGSCP